MKEHGAVDRYLKSRNTRVARLLRSISPEVGTEYLHSRLKRNLDLSIAIPLWLASLPVQGVIRAAIKLEDGGETLYMDQERFSITSDHATSSLPLRKFRTMRLDADTIAVPEEIRGTDKDPRLSKVGRVLRRLNFDELPQLWQVIKGDMSLIGIRAARRRDIFEVGEMVHHPEYALWEEAYMQTGPSIFHPQAALYGRERKGGDYGRLRLHSDIHYAQHASLGTDLYLVTRFALGIRKNRMRKDIFPDQFQTAA